MGSSGSQDDEMVNVYANKSKRRRGRGGNKDDGTLAEKSNLLDLKEVIEEAGTQYEEKIEPAFLRDEFVTTRFRVQDAERRHHDLMIDEEATEEEKEQTPVELMRDENTIRTMYRDEIARALHIDKMCMKLGGAGMSETTDDTLKHFVSTLQEDLGCKVLVALKTVGFLNLPRAGRNHIGNGFVVLAEHDGPKLAEHDGPRPWSKVVTMHFYERSLVAGTANNTTNSENMSEIFVKGIYHRRKQEYGHKQLDDSHRIASNIFGVLPSSDIISLSQFSTNDARVTASIQNKDDEHDEVKCCCCNVSCCFDCNDFLCCKSHESFEESSVGGKMVRSLKDFVDCWCNVSRCFDCNDFLRCKSHKSFEESSVDGKMVRSLKDFVEEVSVEHDRDFTFTTRYPFLRKGDKDVKPNIGFQEANKEVTSKRTVYKGVEICFVDHVDCKKELGLVMFAPDESMANVLKFTATMMQNVVATGQPALKNEYDRGVVNPMLDFGIEQDASANLLGAKSWLNPEGMFSMNPKLCCCPCYPSKDA